MRPKLLALLIAGLYAAPVLAQAPDHFGFQGSVSLGGIGVDASAADAAKLNEYRDLDDGVLAGFTLRGRGARHWFDAFAENLGRDDVYATLRGGMYDVFKYRIYHDALRHNFLFNGRTPYAGAGSANQTATFPRLDPNTWNSLDIGFRRRDTGGHFEVQAASPWYARVEANQVETTGSSPNSSSQGTSPGNGFVDLATPVDYTTKNAYFEGGYASRTLQASVSWLSSKFENQNQTVNWTNGFFGNGTDSTYLPPENEYNRFAANLTYRGLPWGSTFALRYTKDELESSNTLATMMLSSGAAFVATGPNVGVHNGNVENETFTASFHMTPLARLDVRLYANWYERRDNSTLVSYSDGAVNHPYSYDKKHYGIDAYYRINRGNRIGGGYDYMDVERNRFDFDQTTDKRLFVEYKNTMLDNLAARVKYTRLERDSNFLLANSGANSNDPEFWDRFLQAFDLAPLDRDEWKVTLDWTAAPNLDLSLEASSRKNKYRNQVLGRLNDDRAEVYVSASYVVPSGVRFTVFGDWEDISYDSRHRVVGDGSLAGAYDPATPANASNYNWAGTVKDHNYAYGIAVDFQVMERLAVKLSALQYKTDGQVDFGSQQAVTSSSFPQPISLYDDTKRTAFNVKGTYAVSKALSITAGYAYEKYDYKDAQYEGYQFTVPSSNTAQTSYLSGVYANPHYKANIFYGWLTYRF